MSDKPKLLFHSNAGWAPTGYGQQTGLFLPHLTEHYDVTLSAFYGLEGAPLFVTDDIKVLPGLANRYGDETITGHVNATFDGDPRGGLVVTLLDVWVLNPELWGQFNVASWVPIDHDPAPPAVTNFFRRSGAVPIAMSRFGQKMLAEFDPLYVPHGVDCAAYRPMEDAREKVGFGEDDFVVGVVAANKGVPSRKCLPEILEAFARFRAKHDNAKLYLHTELAGKFGGVQIPPLLESLRIPEGALMLGNQYRMMYDPLPPSMMTTLYSAFDVLLSPSRGEGFGIPVLEAAAAGTPAIVSDFSAQPEVSGAGWTVTGSPEWSPQNSWQFRPHIKSIVGALEAAYSASPAKRKELSQKARAHAEGYHVVDVLNNYMLPALEEASERASVEELVA